jgi:hypothetical protein
MPQIWDKNLPSTTRFTILPEFNNEAVRDNNTGLVWERAPIGGGTWAEATLEAIQKQVAGTTGWRLPSIVELNSLRDPSLPPPSIPSAIFNVNGDFWSATTLADDSSHAWFLSFQMGAIGKSGKGMSLLVWCVRGPMQESAY